MALDILTAAEVADLLRVSRDTVYTLASRGELPGREVGRSWRFPKGTIEIYIRERAEVLAHDADATGNHRNGCDMDEANTAHEVRT